MIQALCADQLDSLVSRRKTLPILVMLAALFAVFGGNLGGGRTVQAQSNSEQCTGGGSAQVDRPTTLYSTCTVTGTNRFFGSLGLEDDSCPGNFNLIINWGDSSPLLTVPEPAPCGGPIPEVDHYYTNARNGESFTVTVSTDDPDYSDAPVIFVTTVTFESLPEAPASPPPDADFPVPEDPQPWIISLQPPGSCGAFQQDRIARVGQAATCPPPCGVTRVTLVKVLQRVCVDPSLQATVNGCISAYRSGIDPQAASIIATLDSSLPLQWVTVLPPPAGWAVAGSATIPRNRADGQNGIGTDAKVYLNPTGGYLDGIARDTCSDLIHELAHAAQNNAGTNDNTPIALPGATLNPTSSTVVPVAGSTVQLPRREIVGVSVENCWRAAQSPPLPLRQYYYLGPDPSGTPVFATLPAAVADGTNCTWSGSGL